MRSRALPARQADAPPPRPSAAALVYLRGRDADGRLRGLVRRRAEARPVLGALAAGLVSERRYEALGFTRLGDWSRDRLGLDPRTVSEWARTWERLRKLPRLRAAVEGGEISWAVAGEVVGIATPGTDAACLEAVRGRTVRAVKALVGAYREAFPEEKAGGKGEGDSGPRVRVRMPCSPEELLKWVAACELARRVEGRQMPVWQCAEAMAAERGAATGFPQAVEGKAPPRRRESREDGRREEAFPYVRWRARPARPAEAEVPEDASPLELDRRMREVVGFLQSVDLEIGRILKQMRDRKLYREIGFESLERYAVERLGLAGRTASRLVALARDADRRPEVATAFREGRVTLAQAEVLRHGSSVERAERVTLRRLEEEVLPKGVDFWAPPEVARLFRAVVEEHGLEAVLDHAIASWLALDDGSHPICDRDGWRCAIPACSGRRNLQVHHIWFRSRGGPQEAWNEITLCAAHHLVLLHRRQTVRVTGRMPDGVTIELGVGRYAYGDVKLASS